MPAVYSRSEARERLEGMDHVGHVGDMGTSLMTVVSEEWASRNQTFGGFVRETGWVPVGSADSSRIVIFAPYGEVRE